jgi:hypothetical protein
MTELERSHREPDGEEAEDEQRWKSALMILDACVPPDQRDKVAEEMKTQSKGLWLDIGFTVFGKAVGNTLTLVIGWAVYTFVVAN